MNTLSIRNPIREMDELFHNRLASVLGGEGLQSAAWSPVVDIEESAEAYTHPRRVAGGEQRESESDGGE